MRRFSVLMIALLILAACTSEPGLESGIDTTGFDKSIRPQDDFYQYVNGNWLERTEIPEDKSNYGAFSVLADLSEKRLREIIEEAANSENHKDGSDAQKVGDFYGSFMDSAAIEKLGIEPIKSELDEIAGLKSRNDLVKYFAHARKIGVQAPLVVFVNVDFKNTDEYISYLTQSGLSMPDRDYYLEDNDRYKGIREKYSACMQTIFSLAGHDDAEAKAARILKMETSIAEHHWTRVENRDRNKTYNRYELARLNDLTGKFDWSIFTTEAGIADKNAIVVRQPSFFESFGDVFQQYTIEDWKTYFTWKLLSGASPLLSKTFVDAQFEFFGKTLQGIEKNRPRWKRGVSAVENTLGEVVGKIYVERYFKPEAKARMDELVANLKRAFDQGIRELEWMSEDTQKEALAKLSKFNTKIGYPDKWRDYSKLIVKNNDLAGNMKRSNEFEYQRMIDKLGGPIDRSEWFMNPQTVNAYYNPPMNEIVFPAAILQPPFFNMAADDAVNYGGIGAVIGHEISHGFDDQGRKTDGDGLLRDWWTEADAEEFKKRSEIMVEQYNAFNPIDSMNVNGELTLGENIGDLGGLTIAYKAYKLSLNGKEAPVIDGFTGEQRFFMGWAQVWRRKYRDDELRRRLLVDSHSPSEYRCNGIVANMPEFYEAFGVKENDKLFRPADIRVKIW